MLVRTERKDTPFVSSDPTTPGWESPMDSIREVSLIAHHIRYLFRTMATKSYYTLVLTPVALGGVVDKGRAAADVDV